MRAFNPLATALLALGRGWAEASIVTASVLGSLLLTTMAVTFLEGGEAIWRESLIIAFLVPVAVATPVSAALMSLLRNLDSARHEAHQLANSDLLTGLLNRRRWIEIAEGEFRRAGHDRTPLALLMLDVDNFKQVNDIHGHLVGDRVLCAVADACVGALRPTEAVARWGGEEFVVLLPSTGGEEGARVAERVRRAVAAISLSNHGCRIPVTVSVGVATSEPDPHSPDLERLLHAADCAMYTAKQGGKNQVAIAPPPGVHPTSRLTSTGSPR